MTTDRERIEQLLHDYAWANDEPDLALLGTTFADDVEYRISVAGETVVGPLRSRDVVLRFVAGAVGGPAQRRHVVSNLRLDDGDADERSLAAYVTIVQTVDGALQPVASGVYRATVRREPGGWRIARLAIELDGAF